MRKVRIVLVALILSGLLAGTASAQQGVFIADGSAIGLLAEPIVQRDLKLDEGQIKKAAAASKSAATKLQAVGENARALEEAKKGGGVDAARTGRAKVAAEYKKNLATFLKPEQVKRLREITIQLYYWEVFRDPDLRDELKLTDAQRGKMDEILAGMQKEMRATSILLRDPKTRQTAIERAKTLNLRVLSDLVSVLDDAQKQRWQAMQGPLMDQRR